MASKIMTPWNKIEGDLCAVSGCDRPRKMRSDGRGRDSLCPGHRTRWKRHGDVRADIPIIGDRTGPNNPYWLGDDATYGGVHKRLKRPMPLGKGSARDYLCVNDDKQADDWAYDHEDPDERFDEKGRGPYSLKPEHYLPMCRPCHVAYDRRP